MSQEIQIDPFTRIEGHLAVSLEMDGGVIQDAQCKGEMFRGFEQIMKGRSPLDAQQIIQRICGVCPVSHGLASVLAQEQAYQVKIPENARLIRDIMLAANYLHNHITHFYHLSALDFIDTAGILDYSGTDRFLLGIKEWVQAEFASKKLFPAAPFFPRYEAEYLKNYQGNINVLKNYFNALEVRAQAHQLVAIWAGKMPHMTTLVPGGVTEKITSKKIALCRSKLRDVRDFYENAYLPDLLSVIDAFPEYLETGKGYGNFLSVGMFQSPGTSEKLLPAGTVIDNRFAVLDTTRITEEVLYSKYTADSGFGKTVPEPHKDGAYSWIKAPRYGGLPMEVGPLARVMIAHALDTETALKQATDVFLQKTGLSISQMDSCLGRHAARVIEAGILIDHCEQWIEKLNPLQPTCVDFNLPESGRGVGFVEAPRGALGHWLDIKGKKVDGYECIVPTTWNCSPKDDKGVPGPVEKSLIGTQVADRENPIEAARIIRAYDPCLACAVH